MTTRNTWRRYLLASVGLWHSLFSSSLEKWAELAALPSSAPTLSLPFFFLPPRRPFDYVPVACMAFGGHQVMITLGVLLLIDAGIRSNRQQRERLLVWKWGQLWSDLPSLDGDVRWRLAVISTDSETKEELGALINVKGAGLGGRWGGSVFPFSLSLTLLALEYVS